MKNHSSFLIVAFLGLGISFTIIRAADAVSSDKDNTLVYRAETPDKTWDGWGGASPPTPPGAPPAPLQPQQCETVNRNGAAARTFSGKVVVDGPMTGVEIGIISLVGIHWNLPDAYQWEPVSPDGSFNITDKNYLDAPKALAVRGPNTAWTFFLYNFTPQEGGKNIILTADPSRKIRLTASGSDMVDLANVGYEPFIAHAQKDPAGNTLRRQRFDYYHAGAETHLDVPLPVGEIAIFVHCAGYADYYQIVDTTRASHIHFVLRKAGKMKITVLDADGKPKANSAVSWINPSAPLSLWQTKTGDTGVINANHLVPGTFDLNVAGFPHMQVQVNEDQTTEIIFQDGQAPQVTLPTGK